MFLFPVFRVLPLAKSVFHSYSVHTHECLFALVDRTNVKTRCEPFRGSSTGSAALIGLGHADRMISKWKRTSTRPAYEIGVELASGRMFIWNRIAGQRLRAPDFETRARGGEGGLEHWTPEHKRKKLRPLFAVLLYCLETINNLALCERSSATSVWRIRRWNPIIKTIKSEPVYIKQYPELK